MNTAQKIPAHTPGPWIVGSDGTSVLAMTDSDTGEDTKPFPVVVNTNSGYDAMNYEEAAANAAFIAAAPAMYELLREWQCFVLHGSNRRYTEKEMLDATIAALAAAVRS